MVEGSSLWSSVFQAVKKAILSCEKGLGLRPRTFFTAKNGELLGLYPIHIPYILDYMSIINSTLQSQKAVSAYFPSKQILHFGFAGQCSVGYYDSRMAVNNGG